MGDLTQVKHLAQELRDLDRGRPDEYGAAFAYEAYDLLDDCCILLTSRLVDAVVEVMASDGAVRRDDDDVKLVDVPEFACLGLCRTRHTRELVVHTEVVLQGDGSEGLGSSLDVDALLSFDSLVQAIGVAATVHDTTRLLVDDHDLVVHDDILVILLEEGIGLEELVHGVYALALDSIVREEGFLALGELLGGETLVRQVSQEAGDIGEDEEGRVIRTARQEVDTLVGELDAIVLLVDDEVEFVGDEVHLAHVVGHVLFLDLEHTGLDTRFAEVLDEGLALRHTLVGTEEEEEAFFLLLLVRRRDLLLSVDEELLAELALRIDDGLYIGEELLEELIVTLGHGA